MSSTATRVILCLLLIGALTMSAAWAGVDKKQKAYSVWDKAHYLTDEEIEFIRPGLVFTMESVTINAERRFVVIYRVADDRGQPLDRNGILTPGSVSASFILSYINPGATQYTAYTNRTQTSPITGARAVQASADSGGRTVELALGRYQYTSGTVLAENYPKNATTTLGIYTTRDLRPWGMTRHVQNVLHSWVPDGSPVTTVRDVSSTATCNQCHNPLALHGGSRQELLLCNLCHTVGVIDPDTGRTVDMKVMVHKIHRGEFLPSVQAGNPYIIVGHNQSVHDYSHIVFPQDVRNCTTCHKDATQANNWFLNPTRATCESCHDLINWTSGDGHAGGPQVSDRFCATCHFPEGELEFDASIKGAHTIPGKSRQLTGVNFQIVNVDNARPGRNARIDFRITDNAGNAIPPGNMSRLAVTMSGPTVPDYRWRISENVSNPQVSSGLISHFFTTPIPQDFVGTATFGVEGYITRTLNPGTTNAITGIRDRGDSVFRYVGVTDATAVPRRDIVSDAKCDACHDKLILHGGNRNFVQYCVTCHNPTETDVARRPAAQAPAESIDFRTMIHKIHTGHELARGYVAYGFGNTAHDYSEVGFPGDRRDCEQCHLAGTWNIPLADGRLSVTTLRDFINPRTPPETAACLSCHDSRTAAAHAFVQIAPFGEACGACHGANAEFSIARSHAR